MQAAPIHLRPALNGLATAAVTILVAWRLPPDLRLALFALLLALTGGIYMGFGLVDGRPGPRRTETVVALGFAGLGLAGLALHPWIVAGGWLLHVAWDLLHHDHGVTTRIARWVPSFCLVYDVAVAVAIVVWWPL